MDRHGFSVSHSGRVRACAAAALVSMAGLLAGCHISGRDGSHKDVSIDTPLGGLNVKTDPATVLGKVGLPAFPGAQVATDGDDDKSSADVNLSFGNFKLKVLAAGLQTSASPAEVEAFYRKALAQYSDVIACRDEQPVGTPARTGMGLTCADDKHTKTGHTHTGDREDLELKAGSSERQHIVVLKPRPGGTRMELIALELPHMDGD